MNVLGIDASRAIKKEKTGVEWYSYFLLRAMSACTPEGWRVRCYTPKIPSTQRTRAELGAGQASSGDNILLPERSTFDKLSVNYAKSKVWQWRVLRWPVERGWVQGRLSLEIFMRPPDVLFVPSRILPIVHPARTVTTVHDAVFLTHPELYDPHDLWLQKRGLEFALKFAKKIIVPSRAVREEVVRVGAKDEQVAVVPHGVEIATPRHDVGARNDIGGSYILFIGRIEKKKNVLGLVHAFRSLDYARDIKLILAGPLGYGGDDVLQAIKTFKLEDRVVHLGYIERAQYHGLLKGAAMLVLPSFGEGFGLPVLEAMAAGVPVVCSDLPVLHEVGGNAVQYFNPNGPEDIARGMETVLANEMLRSEMVKRGKERAMEYSWNKSAKATWNVLCNLIGH